jgi:hypothetical protein
MKQSLHMSKSIGQAIRFLLSAAPLFLIAAADTYFFGVADGRMSSGAGILIQIAILTVAALVIVPNMVLRLVCTILLLIVAILGSMTIGLFYIPAVCAAAALTAFQSRANRQ